MTENNSSIQMIRNKEINTSLKKNLVDITNHIHNNNKGKLVYIDTSPAIEGLVKVENVCSVNEVYASGPKVIFKKEPRKPKNISTENSKMEENGEIRGLKRNKKIYIENIGNKGNVVYDFSGNEKNNEIHLNKKPSYSQKLRKISENERRKKVVNDSSGISKLSKLNGEMKKNLKNISGKKQRATTIETTTHLNTESIMNNTSKCNNKPSISNNNNIYINDNTNTSNTNTSKHLINNYTHNPTSDIQKYTLKKPLKQNLSNLNACNPLRKEAKTCKNRDKYNNSSKENTQNKSNQSALVKRKAYQVPPVKLMTKYNKSAVDDENEKEENLEQEDYNDEYDKEKNKRELIDKLIYSSEVSSVNFFQRAVKKETDSRPYLQVERKLQFLRGDGIDVESLLNEDNFDENDEDIQKDDNMIQSNDTNENNIKNSNENVQTNIEINSKIEVTKSNNIDNMDNEVDEENSNGNIVENNVKINNEDSLNQSKNCNKNAENIANVENNIEENNNNNDNDNDNENNDDKNNENFDAYNINNNEHKCERKPKVDSLEYMTRIYSLMDTDNIIVNEEEKEDDINPTKNINTTPDVTENNPDRISTNELNNQINNNIQSNNINNYNSLNINNLNNNYNNNYINVNEDANCNSFRRSNISRKSQSQKKYDKNALKEDFYNNKYAAPINIREKSEIRDYINRKKLREKEEKLKDEEEKREKNFKKYLNVAQVYNETINNIGFSNNFDEDNGDKQNKYMKNECFIGKSRKNNESDITNSTIAEENSYYYDILASRNIAMLGTPISLEYINNDGLPNYAYLNNNQDLTNYASYNNNANNNNIQYNINDNNINQEPTNIQTNNTNNLSNNNMTNNNTSNNLSINNTNNINNISNNNINNGLTNVNTNTNFPIESDSRYGGDLPQSSENNNKYYEKNNENNLDLEEELHSNNSNVNLNLLSTELRGILSHLRNRASSDSVPEDLNSAVVAAVEKTIERTNKLMKKGKEENNLGEEVKGECGVVRWDEEKNKSSEKNNKMNIDENKENINNLNNNDDIKEEKIVDVVDEKERINDNEEEEIEDINEEISQKYTGKNTLVNQSNNNNLDNNNTNEIVSDDNNFNVNKMSSEIEMKNNIEYIEDNHLNNINNVVNKINNDVISNNINNDNNDNINNNNEEKLTIQQNNNFPTIPSIQIPSTIIQSSTISLVEKNEDNKDNKDNNNENKPIKESIKKYEFTEEQLENYNEIFMSLAEYLKLICQINVLNEIISYGDMRFRYKIGMDQLIILFKSRPFNTLRILQQKQYYSTVLRQFVFPYIVRAYNKIKNYVNFLNKFSVLNGVIMQIYRLVFFKRLNFYGENNNKINNNNTDNEINNNNIINEESNNNDNSNISTLKPIQNISSNNTTTTINNNVNNPINENDKINVNNNIDDINNINNFSNAENNLVDSYENSLSKSNVSETSNKGYNNEEIELIKQCIFNAFNVFIIREKSYAFQKIIEKALISVRDDEEYKHFIDNENSLKSVTSIRTNNENSIKSVNSIQSANSANIIIEKRNENDLSPTSKDDFVRKMKGIKENKIETKNINNEINKLSPKPSYNGSILKNEEIIKNRIISDRSNNNKTVSSQDISAQRDIDKDKIEWDEKLINKSNSQRENLNNDIDGNNVDNIKLSSFSDNIENKYIPDDINKIKLGNNDENNKNTRNSSNIQQTKSFPNMQNIQKDLKENKKSRNILEPNNNMRYSLEGKETSDEILCCEKEELFIKNINFSDERKKDIFVDNLTDFIVKEIIRKEVLNSSTPLIQKRKTFDPALSSSLSPKLSQNSLSVGSNSPGRNYNKGNSNNLNSSQKAATVSNNSFVQCGTNVSNNSVFMKTAEENRKDQEMKYYEENIMPVLLTLIKNSLNKNFPRIISNLQQPLIVKEEKLMNGILLKDEKVMNLIRPNFSNESIIKKNYIDNDMIIKEMNKKFSGKQNNDFKYYNILNECILDTVNELVEKERNYGKAGKPLIWSLRERNVEYSYRNNNFSKKIFVDKIIKQLIELINFKMGLIAENYEYFDMDQLSNDREKKFSKSILDDLNHNKDIWESYEVEETQTKLILSKIIMEQMLNEVVEILEHVQFSRREPTKYQYKSIYACEDIPRLSFQMSTETQNNFDMENDDINQ